MDDEINTDKILTHVLSSNKKCYIPRYFMGSNSMDMVRLRDLEDYDKLPRTKWNIKQPSDEDDREEALDTEEGLDLILIPGLAFTRTGARCGRGKGYYDTYLAKVHKKQGRLPATVALAFKEQILEDVPTDHHDVRIDKVLFTES